MKLIQGNRLGWIGLGVLVLSSLSLSALACPGGQSGGQGGGQGGRQGPPQEALSACSGAGENQACQFEAPHGTIVGVCQNIQNQMACVPEGGPPQNRGSQTPQGA